MAEGSSEMEYTKVQSTTSQNPHYCDSPKFHHIEKQQATDTQTCNCSVKIMTMNTSRRQRIMMGKLTK